jgi:hypothetical protein
MWIALIFTLLLAGPPFCKGIYEPLTRNFKSLELESFSKQKRQNKSNERGDALSAKEGNYEKELSGLPLEEEILFEEKLFPSLLGEKEARFLVKYTINGPREDLQEYLVGLLFQKMLELELGTSSYLFLNSPPSFSTVSIACEANQYVQANDELQTIVEKIKRDGFSVNQFEKAKQLTQAALTQKMTFFNEIIEQISLTPFSSITSTLTIEPVELKKTDRLFKPITTMAEQYDLNVGEVEKRLIYEIITTMANKNPIQLVFDKKNLDKKGKKIRHVPPIPFLYYIFSTPILKKSMREIKKDYFKWNAFIHGLSKKMKQEAKNETLNPYIEPFCQQLDLEMEKVSHYIEKHDWEGLVLSLF